MIGILMAAATALAPAAAQAADWWWVAGEPGSRDAWFVDADTISENGDRTSFDLLHVSAGSGAEAPEQQQVDCRRSSPDPIQQFVCASPQQRASLGAMLGPITPDAAASAIFDAPTMQTARR
jgi:hypothetical protein